MDNPYSSPSSDLGGRDSFSSDSGGVTQGVVTQLARTKGWTRFAGVLCIILGAIIVLGALTGGAALGKLGGVVGGADAFQGFVAGMIAIYLIFGGLYLAIGIKLNGFSSAVVRLIYSGRQSDLEDALERQRSFWKLAGILAAILLILAIIGIAAGGADVTGGLETLE